jgi:hypothetical protein
MVDNSTLQKQLNQMVKEWEAGEQKLVDFAVEHGLRLSLGEYGSGKELITTQEQLDDLNRYGRCGDKELGDWIYSNETC